MNKALVTGASGLLGRPIFSEITAAGLAVRGTALSRVRTGLDRLDLCDGASLQAYLNRVRPDVIVHTAAERHPDVSEKDPQGTRTLNVTATRRIAEWARDAGAWVIYISTDYVFDGTRPPYRPDDTTCPLNAYGLSKRDGERALLAACPQACVLRVPILYGAVEFLAESAVTAIAESMVSCEAAELVLDDWATRYPTLTDDVAVVCRQLIEHARTGNRFTGICHWSGDEPMTKYAMGTVMAGILRPRTLTLVPNPSTPSGAPRPKDCHLDCSELQAIGIGRRTPFRDAIADVLEDWRSRA